MIWLAWQDIVLLALAYAAGFGVYLVWRPRDPRDKP